MASPTASVPSVPASVIEALFIRALPLDGHLRSLLRREGVEIERLASAYPALAMFRCVEGAAEHLHPGVPKAQSHRWLGRRFMEGFQKTLVGSVVVASMPLWGPDRLMSRLGRLWTVGQNYGRATSELLEQAHWRFSYEHREHATLPSNPHFSAGAIECALGWTRVVPRVEVEQHDGPAFSLSVRW